MRKKLTALLVLTFLLVSLSACGGDKIITTAEDGIVLTLPSSWNELELEEGLNKAYGSAGENYQDIVQCVLEDKYGSLLTVEKYDVQEYLEAQKNYLNWLKRQYELLPAEEVENWLNDQNSDNALLSAYKEAVINNDFSAETVKYIEILSENSEWLSQLSELEQYELLAQEEAEILEQKTQVLQYKYATAEDTLAQFMECSVIKDGMIYTISIWGGSEDFSKNAEDYRSILTTLAWADAEKNTEE